MKKLSLRQLTQKIPKIVRKTLEVAVNMVLPHLILTSDDFEGGRKSFLFWKKYH